MTEKTLNKSQSKLDDAPVRSPKCRVLIVEDSPVVREFLTYILSSDPAIQVVGVATNGVEAIVAVARLRPDVITMDIHMPVMDGYEATRRIMETIPTPTVIVSGFASVTEVAFTFRAIEAGALAVVRRPQNMSEASFKADSKELLQTVKLMSEIKVVKRFARETKKSNLPLVPVVKKSSGVRIIAIGASTGGPPALQKLLTGLPADFSVPILIVQHITAGFVTGFAKWLGEATGRPTHIATHGDVPLAGHIYIAPDNKHMGITHGPVIELSDHPPEHLLRPAVSYMFRTVAQVMGSNSVGILLTGMGRDGADDLKVMQESGAVTIVQNKESSVVYGMPGEAVKIGAAAHILPPEEISKLLVELVNPGTGE